jgi:hypothetical protein
VVEVVFGEGGVRGRSITRFMEAPLSKRESRLDLGEKAEQRRTQEEE